MNEKTWITLAEAAPLFGMTYFGIKNSVSMNRFPVPTFKLGRTRVIDKAVLDAFFEQKKKEGLAALQKSTKEKS